MSVLCISYRQWDLHWTDHHIQKGETFPVQKSLKLTLHSRHQLPKHICVLNHINYASTDTVKREKIIPWEVWILVPLLVLNAKLFITKWTHVLAIKQCALWHFIWTYIKLWKYNINYSSLFCVLILHYVVIWNSRAWGGYLNDAAYESCDPPSGDCQFQCLVYQNAATPTSLRQLGGWVNGLDVDAYSM